MSDSEIRTGKVFGGRFVVKGKLGAGGFGSVWLATDAREHRDVALKVLHEKFMDNAWVLDRFQREAEVLLQLDHPNIARPIAAAIDSHTAYLAMEYVEGDSLDKEIADHAERDRHYDFAAVAELLEELAAAIDYAHGKTIVHRDLKPKNVQVLRRRGRLTLKVLDFGVAKILADTGRDATTVGRLLGSLLYMSPEQALSASIDLRADVFSLGTILFELLTLKRAWAWDDDGKPLPATDAPIIRSRVNNHMSILKRIATEPRPRVRDVRPELNQAIDEVVLRAMAIDASARFRGAGDLARAFRRAALPGTVPRIATPVVPVRPLSGSVPDTVLRAPDSTIQDSVPPGLTELSAPDGEDDGLTSVMPSNHDARDLVGPVTQTRADPTAVRFNVSLPSSSYPVALNEGSFAPSRVAPAPAKARTALTLVAGVALGVAVTLLITLYNRQNLPPTQTPAQPLPTAPLQARGPGAVAPTVEPPTQPDLQPDEPPTKTARATKTRPRVDRPTPKTPKPAAKPYADLRAQLAAARNAPGDLERLTALAKKIREAAARLPNSQAKQSIVRKATLSEMDGDLGRLESCVRELVAVGEP